MSTHEDVMNAKLAIKELIKECVKSISVFISNKDTPVDLVNYNNGYATGYEQCCRDVLKKIEEL